MVLKQYFLITGFKLVAPVEVCTTSATKLSPIRTTKYIAFNSTDHFPWNVLLLQQIKKEYIHNFIFRIPKEQISFFGTLLLSYMCLSVSDSTVNINIMNTIL
jgi:hypothetical protein